MLGKLIKYEMKAGERFFVPLYAVMIVMAALIGLTSRYQDSVKSMSYVFGIAMLLYGILIVAAIVLTIYLLVERFYHNLLGNEGYLMFTLPVSTASHICAKVLTALIWMIIGVGMVMLSSLVMGFLSISWQDLQRIVEGISEMMANFHFDGDLLLQSMEILMLVALGSVSSIVRIYAAISIGHFWTDHKVLGAVLSFIGFTILEVFVMISFAMTDISMDIWLVYFYDLLWIAVYGLITWYVLDRHLNLE